ncbi:MAG: trans-aconitate 2-methyltransferase [Chloroflexota bacterium]
MTTMQDQAGALLGQLAGYVGVRTVGIGLSSGLIKALAANPGGLSAKELAHDTQLDPFYTQVWCRAAHGAGVLDDAGADRYRLADHMDTLLLDDTSPGYVGAVITIMDRPEIFDGFSDDLATGEGTWWDECSAAFIDNVASTGAPFNTRLIPGGLDQVPGLGERLNGPARILELACGAGRGLMRLAEHYPQAEIVGLDGDAHSLEIAARSLAAAGVADRVTLIESAMEGLEAEDDFDLVTINISMHECRDLDEVTTRVLRALRPGGYFVNSDFPFPADEQGLRSVPGRVMSGIQFFEARIGDQLVPITHYLDLLRKHGFREVDHFEITPVHAVTHGRR